jgi:acyl-coenzyme A synthetase/AMP-(fatty) acid ligase
MVSEGSIHVSWRTSCTAFVAERVLPYKKVRAVHVVVALPTSPVGKVLKAELRA